MLQIKNIRKAFREKAVLDDISLDINEGELFFLLGPSGCGKTTMLRIIAGLTGADSGAILFRGKDISSLSPEKRNLGMVFQNYSLWPHMSVFDNVAYGLKRRNDTDKLAERVEEALGLAGLDGYGQRMPGTLSGGEQQRAALARALVYKSDLILLDEPLSNLDARLRKELRTEIRRIHDKLKATMIYVTHDQEEATAMADRMALLNNGKVAQVGTPREIYNNPADAFTADFFGHANVVEGVVEAGPGGSTKIRAGELLLDCGKKEGFKAGEKLSAVIRPDSIHLFK